MDLLGSSDAMDLTEESGRDRLSDLPQHIIHEMLSYLLPKEAARTCSLSKTWLRSYSTFPILYFDEFVWRQEIKETNFPFFNFLHNTLLRYKTLNLRIRKLRIKVLRVDHESAHHLLDKSLELAFDNGVQELNIDAPRAYTLPLSLFDSPKVLNFLRVYRCKFPQNLVTPSKRNAINFPLLKTLNLENAHIDDAMLQKLLSNSPSLETIFFSQASGLKKFRVNNLVQLKGVDIHCSGEILMEIDIEDVPNLRVIRCWASNSTLLNLGCAQNLRYLSLNKVKINDGFLEDFSTKFPLLEYLTICLCNGLKRINILSHSLKLLYLVQCDNLVEAEIDASNLLKFAYFGEIMLCLSLNNTPAELMPHICIFRGGAPNLLSDAWFLQLGELLKRVIRARVSFIFRYLHIRFYLEFTPHPISLEHHTDNFMPEMNSPDSLFVVFANTIFSCSRPTTIESCSCTPTSIDFMKFLGSELTRATRNSNCCRFDGTKCWRYYLKDIKAEVYEESQKVWQPLHQETLRSEYTFPRAMIRFGLRWCENLNAQG